MAFATTDREIYHRTFAEVKTSVLQSIFFLGSLLLPGCDLIDVHPYDADIDGACDINAQNIQRIEERCAGRNEIRIAVISDTQRWYDETEDEVNHINSRGDIDFVIHCGDLTDFSVTKEFEWMRRELEKFTVPYVVLLGNHDCLGNGLDLFRKIYGAEDFSFTAGDTHFVCLNTNGLEFGNNVPDFQFISNDRANVPATVRRTVAAMHCKPNSDQFYGENTVKFHEEMKKYPSLQFCLCGHYHSTKVEYPFDDGIPYYQCAAAKNREYLIITLTKEGGIDYEVATY